MEEDLTRTIVDAASDDQMKAYVAKRKIRDLAHRAKGDDRAKLAARLADELAADKDMAGADQRMLKRMGFTPPKHSAKSRVQLGLALSVAGGEAEVDKLVNAAEDFDSREYARYALERIPGDKATAALIKLAKEAVGSDFRVGAVNALGRRPGAEAVAGLMELCNDSIPSIVNAAIDALANHPDPSIDARLAEIHGKRRGPGGGLVARARVRHAWALAGSGNAEAAKKVLQDVMQRSPNDAAIQKACKIGLKELGVTA